MNANGKADLYFHAYFLKQYVEFLGTTADVSKEPLSSKNLEALWKRIDGLAETLSKVIVNVEKFPYNKETYEKHVESFGKRKADKKNKNLQ